MTSKPVAELPAKVWVRRVAKSREAALTLPMYTPLLKSCAPCSVMFSGGCAPVRNSVTVTIAVFCAEVPLKVTRRVMA